MIPKQKPLRIPKLLSSVVNMPCMYCGAIDGTIVAAHCPDRILGGGGLGQKADDCLVAALCFRCHNVVDSREGSLDREARHLIWHQAYARTVRQWFRDGVIK